MSVAQLTTILGGTWTALQLTFFSISMGVILAFLIAVMRLSKFKIANAIAWVYVWIIRGTPLLLQLLIVHFVVPIVYKSITGDVFAIPMFVSALIAFTMNTAAYVSEVIRAGIESIDKGQFEAAKALGMNRFQAMTRVIIPQTIKRLIPPFANEFTTLLKDTSICTVIGMPELMKVSRQFAASGNWLFYFYAGAIYLLLTTLATILFQKLEKIAGKYE